MSKDARQDDSNSSSSYDRAEHVTSALVSPTAGLRPAQDPQPRPASPGAEPHDAQSSRQSIPVSPSPPLRAPQSSSFSNLLNPTRADDDVLPEDRRRKAADMESPTGAIAPLWPPKQRQSPASGAGPGSAESSQHRKVLMPRSPSLHRAASMVQLQGPSSSIDARQSPFLNSQATRSYTAEPGSVGVPPLPTTRSYTAHTAIAPLDTRMSSSTTLDSRPRSPSISPRTAYATHHGIVRSSPSTTALPSLASLQYHSEPDQRPMSIPITSTAGPNVYQMMTLQTSAGTVHLPVDVQAASKVADEKRKRNAGASARFRARRKEKEKESSSTISKLEMQVKDLTEDADFYRRERNYLASIVMSFPSGDRHFPRPPSPRLRRSSIGMQPSISGSSDYMSGQEIPRSPGDGRNVRRRISGLPLAATQPIQPAQAGPSNYAQHYERSQYHQHPPAPTHQPHQLYQQQQEQRQQHHHRPQHQLQQQHQQQQSQTSLPGPARLLQQNSPQTATSQSMEVSRQVPGWTTYGAGRLDTRPDTRSER